MRTALTPLVALFFTTVTGCEISQPVPEPEMEEITPGSSSVTERTPGTLRCPADQESGCQFTTFRNEEDEYYLIFGEYWLRYDPGDEEPLLWWKEIQDVGFIECCYYGGCAYLDVHEREDGETKLRRNSYELCSPTTELPPGYM